MRILQIEPRLDGLMVDRLDEFKRTPLPGGKPRSQRQFVNSHFSMRLSFVMQPPDWEYLLRFERSVGSGSFQFYASYHSDKKELFTGCFTSPVALESRAGSSIFASATVSALPDVIFNPANDEAYLDIYEQYRGNPKRLAAETDSLS